MSTASEPPGELSLEERRRLLAQFGSRAVHDIAGPIDQVSSLIALFVRKYQNKIDDDADTLLSHIDASRRRLANTGAGLRRYFRVVTAEAVMGPVDLNAVWRAAVTSLAKQIAESDAEICTSNLPQVCGDSELLTLLFQALLDNSLKFRRNGLRPLIEISAAKGTQRHSVAVVDNGIGIETAHSEVVLEPFKKMHGQMYPGAGLGLATAQLIAHLHGGSIRIEPREAPGTRVVVDLPVA